MLRWKAVPNKLQMTIKGPLSHILGNHQVLAMTGAVPLCSPPFLCHMGDSRLSLKACATFLFASPGRLGWECLCSGQWAEETVGSQAERSSHLGRRWRCRWQRRHALPVGSPVSTHSSRRPPLSWTPPSSICYSLLPTCIPPSDHFSLPYFFATSLRFFPSKLYIFKSRR